MKHQQKILYSKNIDLFKTIDVSVEYLIKQIELVLETIYVIESNANVALLMDSLMYRL